MKSILLTLTLFLCSWHLVQAQRGELVRDGGRATNTSRSTSRDSSQQKVLPLFTLARVGITPLNGTEEPLDTLATDVITPEPYYTHSDLIGTLGSPNAAGYTGKYQGLNRPAIALGYHMYDHLTNENDDQIIKTSRTLIDIQYQQDFVIEGSDIVAGLYKQFDNDVLLNFEYEQHKDDGIVSLQSNKWDNIALQLAQLKADRRTYFSYHRFAHEENHARTLSNSSLGSSNYGVSGWTIGNWRQLSSNDSTQQSTWWSSELSSQKNGYNYSTTVDDNTKITLGLDKGVSSLSLDQGLSTLQWANGLTRKNQSQESLLEATIRLNSLRNSQDTVRQAELGIRAHHVQVLAISQLIGSADVAMRKGETDYSLGIELTSDKTRAEIVHSRAHPDLAERTLFLSATDSIGLSLSPSRSWALSASYQDIVPGLHLEANVELTSDAIVPSALGKPVQLEEDIFIANLTATYQWAIRRIKGNTALTLQHINNNVIPRPSAYLKGDIGLPFTLVRDKLDAKIGMNYLLATSYHIPAYNPLYGSFYNDGSGQKSGVIAIFDPYIQFDIDRFHAYLKTTNPMTRVTGFNKRFFVKDYPIYDYRIALGVLWRFLD